MGQKQHEIPLHYRDGRARLAIRTGNNAAWICACDRYEPLLGYSDVLDGPISSDVVCPDCGRTYRIVAPGAKKVPEYVHEIKPRDS